MDAVVTERPNLWAEVNSAIKTIDATTCASTRISGKTLAGRSLYRPNELNRAIKNAFETYGDWRCVRVRSESRAGGRVAVSDVESIAIADGIREMDFVKDRIGIEIQFGMPRRMVCSLCAKMTIFHNLGHIDAGVEIVPVKAFAEEMSTGVSYFEQFVWDLEARGISNIDIPVLILGIDC